MAAAAAAPPGGAVPSTIPCYEDPAWKPTNSALAWFGLIHDKKEVKEEEEGNRWLPLRSTSQADGYLHTSSAVTIDNSEFGGCFVVEYKDLLPFLDKFENVYGKGARLRLEVAISANMLGEIQLNIDHLYNNYLRFFGTREQAGTLRMKAPPIFQFYKLAFSKWFRPGVDATKIVLKMFSAANWIQEGGGRDVRSCLTMNEIVDSNREGDINPLVIGPADDSWRFGHELYAQRKKRMFVCASIITRLMKANGKMIEELMN